MAASGNQISPIEERVGERKVRVGWTRSGLVFAGLGVAFFAVGMWRVDGVMASMGLAAGVLLAVVRGLGCANLRGLDLGYRGPRRIEAGKGFEAKVELLNHRRILDAFWIDFGVRVMDEKEVSGRTLWLETRGSAVVGRRISLKGRGLAHSHRAWVRSAFPLGLMRFEKRLGIEAEVGVLPLNKVPDELRFSGFLLDGLPFGGSRQFGGIGEWKGLREWRGGDPVRKIAWSASLKSEASGGGLLVRQDEPPGSQTEACVVVFHSHGGDRNLIRPDRFEKSISLLSGVLGCLQGYGIPTRLMADFRDWEPLEIRTKRQLAAAREELMLAARAGWTETHDLSQALGGVESRECLVVVSDMPADSWQGFLPQMVLKPVIVDIAKHDRAARRNFLNAKGGCK